MGKIYRLFFRVQYIQGATTISVASNHPKIMAVISQSIANIIVSFVCHLGSKQALTTDGEDVQTDYSGTTYAWGYYNTINCRLSKRDVRNTSYCCKQPWFLPFVVSDQNGSSLLMCKMYGLFVVIQGMEI